MNKAVSLIISIFLVFSFIGTTFSADKGKKIQVFAGLIKTIDVKEKTITLQNDKTPEFTCIIDDKAVIRMANGKKSMVADIRIGDIAAVAYEEINGKNIATSITAMTPAASSSSEKANPANSEGKK